MSSTRATIEFFIGQVRIHPPIWNRRHPMYGDTNSINSHWMKILDSLQRTFKPIDLAKAKLCCIQDLKTKLRNLRTSYKHALKTRTSSYQWSKQLSFLSSLEVPLMDGPMKEEESYMTNEKREEVNVDDDAEFLGRFISTKLREMSPKVRQGVEKRIFDIVLSVNVLEPSSSNGITHEEPRRLKEDPLQYYQCSQCDYRAKSNSRITKHEKNVHGKEKNYTCELCGRGFSESGNLKVHVRDVHLKEKNFRCEICAKPFAQNSVLKRHIETVHDLVKKHHCEYCGKSFGFRSTLNKHIRVVHHGERNHVCPVCQKPFSSNYELKKHNFGVHLQQKPYKCNVCEIGYHKQSELSLHKKTEHTEDGKFLCSECGKSFATQPILNSHLKINHNCVVEPAN